MKEFIEKYQKTIVGIGAVSVLLICYFQQKELTHLRTQLNVQTSSVAPLSGDIRLTNLIDSLETEKDSLVGELFIERVDAGRHEITREEILGKYPKIAKEYDEFYLHNTE